jgi:hypothetical protein
MGLFGSRLLRELKTDFGRWPETFVKIRLLVTTVDASVEPPDPPKSDFGRGFIGVLSSLVLHWVVSDSGRIVGREKKAKLFRRDEPDP